MLRKKETVRPRLKPISPRSAGTYFAVRVLPPALIFVYAIIALLFEQRVQHILVVLADECGIQNLAVATSLFAMEFMITIGAIAFLSTRSHLPFNHIFLGPLRYHRTHASHMRIDRLRRLVNKTYTSDSIQLLPPPSRHNPCARQDWPCHPIPCIMRPRMFGGAACTGAVSFSEPIYLSDTSDEDSPTSFVHSEWIGCGRSWHDALPRYVRRARDAARAIPPSVTETLIPTSSVPVAEAVAQLSSDFPGMANQATGAAQFIPDTPNILTDDVSEPEFHTFLSNLCRPHLLHSIDVVSQLRSSFDNAWLSGARSIRLDSAPNYHWPLWTERLLGNMGIAVEKLRKWHTASQWLRRIGNSALVDADRKLIKDCHEHLAVIPWDSTIPGLGHAVMLTTSHLACFLSDSWLDDEMINAGMSYILQRFNDTSRVRLANCFFINALRDARKRSAGDPYCARASSMLDHDIAEGRVDVLEIPFNPGGHWTGIKVDLVSQTLAYRDGANPHATITAELHDLLVWYLQAMVGGSLGWTILPPLQCPRQTDSFSCGISYLSTLSAEYLGSESWSQQHFARHRMQWFLRLSERLMNKTSEDTYVPGTLCTDTAIPSPKGLLLDDVEFIIVDDDSSASPLQASCLPLPSSSGDVDCLESLGEWSMISLKDSSDTSFPATIPSGSLLQTSASESHVGSSTLSAKRVRRCSSDETASDSGASDSDDSFVHVKRPRLPHHNTLTSSWAQQKALKVKSRTADFQANESNLGRFRQKVRDEDPHAEFKAVDLCAVHCSACATWIQMRALYDLKRWKEHRNSVKCTKQRSKGLITKSLHSFFGPKPTITTPATAASRDISASPYVPCTGLTREANFLVNKYLRRTAVDGGGAPSRERIARQLFKRTPALCRWSVLSPQEQLQVTRREQQLRMWVNKHSLGAVFSVKCLGEAVPSFSNPDYAPCKECLGLLHVHLFQNALNVPLPPDKNTKFVPNHYRSSALGDLYLRHKGLQELIEMNDGQTPWLRFAKGAVAGDFKTQGTVLAMVEAMVMKTDRVRKGKSLRNMHYPEGLDAFSSYLASISRRAYLAFQRTFGGRTLRSIQHLQAKQPHFEPDIAVGNIKRAKKILEDLQYSGPLGLSWDDTDLEKALTIRQESKEAWLVLGASQGTIRVTSVEEVELLLQNATLAKAEKLRIWVLSIPLPRIPPILLAAMARGSKDST